MIFRVCLLFTTVLLTLPLEARTEESILLNADKPHSILVATKTKTIKKKSPPQKPPALPMPKLKPKGDKITLEQWNKDDWLLVKPRVSFVDLNGYLRFRTTLFRKLDFDNQAVWENTIRYPNNSGSSNSRKADFTGANMRLRLEPQINVTSSVHVITTIDIFDNLSLGSTPDTIPFDSIAPNNVPNHIESRGQRPPRKGWNSLSDSVVVKRAYGRVTALNEQLELRFGRMPNHWGLGMMANAGDCLDCDYGDVVDRFSLSFKIADIIFAPMFDWVSSGPAYAPFGRSGGQPLDAVTWDDVAQYSLRLARIDHPEDIKDALENGNYVLNFGVWGIYRRQSRDLVRQYYDSDIPTLTDTAGSSVNNAVYNTTEYIPGKLINLSSPDERRNAGVYTGNAFGKLYLGRLELGVEVAVIYGKFTSRLAYDRTELEEYEAITDEEEQKNYTFQDQDIDIWKFGAAAELKLRFGGEYSGSVLSIKGGWASGDSAPGFGALDKANTQWGYIDNPGSDNNGFSDRSIENFQFSPDYHVDLLLFRQIIGTVTDAWYIRPEISYMFDEKVNGRLAAIYSHSVLKRSTASCYDPKYQLCRDSSDPKNQTGSRPLGLELNAELAYGLLDNPNGGAFRAAIAGGALFPLGAFKNNDPDLDEDERDPSFAWTIQARLYIAF